MRRRIRLIKVRCVRGRGQRLREEQRNRRNQLEHVLSRHTLPALGCRSFRVHHPVYPGFLRNDLVAQAVRNGLGLIRASAVPDASHVVSGDDLNETTGLDMSDLNESAVEKEDVRWVPGDPFRCALPLDCANASAWVSVFVYVQPELYGSN